MTATTTPTTPTTIATPMDLGALTQRLSTSTWTLAAIAALFESGLLDSLIEPRTVTELADTTGIASGRIAHCLAVCASVGVVVADGDRFQLAEGVRAVAVGPMRDPRQGDLRSSLMQPLAFVDAMARREPGRGWRHLDPALLQAQGAASAIFPTMFKANIVGTLGDLAARLDRPGARCLDVGAGVGALTIGLCKLWPELHAVGLDPFESAVALARTNVANAGLSARVELRQLAVEALTDESAFDFAWLPSFFIAPDLLSAAIARVVASLRPGGWIVMGGTGAGGDPQQRATAALVNELWGGGPVRGSSGLEALLEEAGLTAVRIMPSPPTLALVVGQRA